MTGVSEQSVLARVAHRRRTSSQCALWPTNLQVAWRRNGVDWLRTNCTTSGKVSAFGRGRKAFANIHKRMRGERDFGESLGAPMQHSARIISIQFSPDGKRIATASADHTARVWDADTGAPVSEPLKHAGYVKSAKFSPDGERVVTAGMQDKTAYVWDINKSRAISGPMRARCFVIAKSNLLFLESDHVRANRVNRNRCRIFTRRDGLGHVHPSRSILSPSICACPSEAQPGRVHALSAFQRRTKLSWNVSVIAGALACCGNAANGFFFQGS